MRTALLAIVAASALLNLSGCAQLFGEYQRPTVCKSKNVSASAALKDAPVWVPGSPMREGKPESGICGDGSVHLDRLCVVGDVANVSSIDQDEGKARRKSLRMLGEELDKRMRRVLGGSAPPDAVTAASDQMRDSIGRVTDTWLSPNCTAYAIAEVETADFELVVRGPSLSADAKTLLLDNARNVVGP